MSKKIIALSLAIFLIITCFVACGKKYETTKINGQDVVVVTDAEGNPVINDKNQVAVLVTDFDGNVVKHENGEDQTRYMQIYDAFEVNGVARGDKYNLNVLEGWTVGEMDRIYKNGTENKCYIQFVTVKETNEKENFTSYFQNLNEQNSQLIDGLKNQGYTVDIEKESISVEENSGWHYIYKITDSDGKVIHYAENCYFVVAKTIYSINYACTDGVGYDETFDFGSYVNANFTYID